MESVKNEHYSDDYFKWQSQIGVFGGIANRKKFEEYIKPSDFVVDFGVGGGYLIEGINCAKKIGIEIKPSARAAAEARGLTMYENFNQIEDSTVDVVISNHALEHTDAPLEILRQIHRVLKKNGKVIFVVPCEAVSLQYVETDTNFHLYTWSPMNLGNLFRRAGFDVVESKPYMHKWPPSNFRTIQKYIGWTGFHFICRIYSHLSRRSFQVRCIAVKKT